MTFCEALGCAIDVFRVSTWEEVIKEQEVFLTTSHLLPKQVHFKCFYVKILRKILLMKDLTIKKFKNHLNRTPHFFQYFIMKNFKYKEKLREFYSEYPYTLYLNSFYIHLLLA